MGDDTNAMGIRGDEGRLTHQETIVGLVEGTNDPSEQYRDWY
ncbi:hypothetical protein [Haloquadratum walsbyi]|nr:hypothetical protein [Haloquadratum walsbyi]